MRANNLHYFNLFFIIILCFSSCKDEPNLIEEEEKEPVTCRTEPFAVYDACVEEPDAETFDIATWNIERFPQQDDQSSTAVRNIINSFQADVIAVQEISNTASFFALADEMEGWEAQLIPDGNLSLGFIYNTCEVEYASELTSLNIGGSSPFPRDPIEITMRHISGLEITFINIHLKCCDDGIARRTEASTLLKAYIDEEYPVRNVILLGDFNGEIHEENSSFENFIEDSQNYKFADMEIAKGSEENFSYPGWPSHIDHILVTNELFDNLNSVKTVRLDDCYSPYYTVVSDHRPVLVSLNKEN